LKQVIIQNQPQPQPAAQTQLTFEQMCDRKRKATTIDIPSNYIDLTWIEPTSNRCERLNSIAKLINDPLRRSMYPKTLEDLVMLKYNPTFWDIHTIAVYFKDKRNLQRAEEADKNEADDEDDDEENEY
jgi:hypothetical protein